MTGHKVSAATAARLRALLEVDVSEEVEPPPPAWKPEPGDVLLGSFIGWVTVTARFEKKHQIALVQDTSGARYSVWCSPKMLRSEMKKADPRPGDAIAIKRLEDRDVGKPHPLKQFKVAVDRSNGSPPRSDQNTERGTR